jgi:CBS domain-containing protein
MQFNQGLTPEQSLEDAIDRQPLVVAPNVLLSEVITLMSQRREKSDTHLLDAQSDDLKAASKSFSYALVMQDNNLQGIFTERDVVKLAASGVVTEGLMIGSVMTANPITLPKDAYRDIFGPLFLFRRFGIRHLPIVDENGLVGVLSADSIRKLLRPIDLLKLKRVSEVMTTPVITAPLTCLVSEAAQLMSIHQVSCVVIIQETEVDDEIQKKPVGIITVRDIVQFLSIQLNLSQVYAYQVMSTPLFLLQPEDTLWKAYQEMESRHVRRLVVTWDWGRGIGIITQTNLLRSLDFGDVTNIENIVDLTVRGEQKQIQQVLKQKIDEQKELERLLSSILENLSNILVQNSLPADALQSHVKSALFNIEQIQNLLRYLNQHSKDALQNLVQEAPREENFNLNSPVVILNPNHLTEDDEDFGIEKVGCV